MARFRRTVLLLTAIVGLTLIDPGLARATTITVVNLDSAGEGFNDGTAVSPVGGNQGTTLGAQRLVAFQQAANIWAGLLSSPVTIRVGAQMDPLACNSTSAILGSAGPTQALRDFSGAPVANTWYPIALANALSGSDLDPGYDISATFNSSIGTTCTFPLVWYYGLDGNPPSGTIDFVSVVLHELGHGLGFLTFMNLSSGAKLAGFNDTFMLNLERHGASPPDFPSMTSAQRVAASTDTGNLHWVGAHVQALSGVLTAGRVGTHVRMYAPNPQQPGSSVSHWDTALTPNQVMEPSYTGALHDPDLEVALFQDLSWTTVLSCAYKLDPTGASYTAAGGSGSIAVTAPSGCGWNVTNPASWITINGGTSGSGDGTVNYTVAANAAMTSRSANLTVAGLTFTVMQAASTNAPQAVSVTPASGSGASQVFSYAFSDGSGFADITAVQLLINSSLSAVNGCYMYVVPGSGLLWLMNDGGSQWQGPVTLGAPGALQNSQCSIDAAGSSVSGAGTSLTINVATTLKPTFAGAKTNFMLASDNANQSSGWQAKGTWNVPAGNPAPTASSVTPASGSGGSQTFSYVFSDGSGFADITSAQLLINGSLSAVNGCYMYVVPNSASLWLMNDGASQWQGPITLGTAGILQNSQCTVDGTGSSVSGAGSNRTIIVALSFTAAFSGSKTNFMLASDSANQSSGWQAKGTWTVTGAVNSPPSAVSVTPSSGSGGSATFSYLFSDGNGFADIATAQLLVNAALSAANGCYMYVVAGSASLWLMDDNASQWQGPITLGSAGTLQNSQCSVAGSGSSVSGAGGNRTIAVALTFKPAFSGAKTNFMLASDSVNQSTGWQAKGTWTVP